MKKIIAKLKREIRAEENFYKSYKNPHDWWNEESIVITPNEAQKIIDKLNRLQHYRDSTVGLWATDKPEKVNDPDGVLFQLEDD